VGTVEECYEQLMERREAYGLNCPNFGVADVDALTPLAERIAGAEAMRLGPGTARSVDDSRVISRRVPQEGTP
jgi:hypothetical protein